MKLNAESYLKSGSNELRILEYRAGGMSFGINILKVSKIVSEMKDFLQIPEAHPAVKGMFKDLGNLVPVIDLAEILAIEPQKTHQQKVIVTEFFGRLTGFLVDRIDWIYHFEWKDVVDVNQVLSFTPNKYTIGIVRPKEDHIVQLLDYETILIGLHPPIATYIEEEEQLTFDFHGKHILLAEDSPAMRMMLVKKLNSLGAVVDDASDGEEGWEKFQEKPYDLVISDIEMPRMDGLAFTLRIRQSGKKDTPVIVYSSIGDIGMKTRAAYLKANAHITKLNLRHLLVIADKLLRGETLTVQETGYESVQDTFSNSLV